MSKNRLVAAIVAVACVAAGSRGLAQESTHRVEAAIGRYQLLRATEGYVMMIDTATGQCWSRDAGGEWRDVGNPTQTKTKTSAQPGARIAPKLELPQASIELTVMQREERSIPGSEGTVRIRISDITEGQVLISVVTDDDRYLLDTVSVRQGDTLGFPVDKQQYTLHVEELRNVLIGDDFAKIVIAREPNTAKNRREVEKDSKP